MQELQQKSNELLQEEIRRAIREKLSRFTFPCPHCREDINDEHFIKELEQQKIYENFQAVKELKETIKHHEQKIVYLQAPEHIENSIRVKKLEEEKKELNSKYQSKIDNLQTQNQDLQKQILAKQEQIQNLVLRQKGQGKGQDFEKWFYEELVKVFDGQDRITDVSKDNSWVEKLERDMVFHHADYGFIVAACEGDKIIRSAKTTDPRKKIYISGDNINLFLAIKTIRELLITRHNLTKADDSNNKEQKLKKIEE
ncbi:7565_t:CDS:2 [Funneliformis geosporum]|uniref:5281_t:CDS:1 n=1 Tax=Funneliformis geosporum TaxID=1117311 RepID=A0A9W4WYH9_9GLOM|nr:5281_t:CDS:2 [Funneliformis geosporum]CAI2184831.1 7565_t:CDS:2 [Funneliformis geosporum]